MNKRLEELAQMRAPNNSGVDARAVIQALGDTPNSLTVPPAYAFGMKVVDAQREGALVDDAQMRRYQQAENARDAAMKQDKQLFDIAVQANQMYMQERDQAIRQRVADAEASYKKALTDKNAKELERLELENAALADSIEREKNLDALTIEGPDGKTYPLRFFLKYGGNKAWEFLTGRRNGVESPIERQTRQRADVYVKWGVNPDDAVLLGAANVPQTFGQIAKAVATQKKYKKPEFGGVPDWGSKQGYDENGRETTIPLTESEWEAEELGRQIDNYFAFLEPQTRAILKQRAAAISALGGGESSQTQDPFANIDMLQLFNSLTGE